MIRDEPDDSALLRAHVSGDPTAFEQLVRRHRDRLWAVALRTTGDPEDAADALQEALVSAFRNAAAFREESQVTTWLHRIVVNACLDRLRRRARALASPLTDDALAIRPGEDGESVADSTARRIDVEQALNSLHPDQRAALVLVDMEGYPVQEAARILQCAPGTVKSRCSRGRVRLADLLGTYRRNPASTGDVQLSAAGASDAAEPSAADNDQGPVL